MTPGELFSPADKWPRLSLTLRGEKHPQKCQGCGSATGLSVWQEHDDRDQPQAIAVVLCRTCSDAMIEDHPRLYRCLERWEPWPGVMEICIPCAKREGVRCTHPDLKANGGAGIRLTYPPPSTVHIDGRDKSGRRFGTWRKLYMGPVTECVGRLTPGICSVCGCTEQDCRQCIEAQGHPCSWANEQRTLCTRCAGTKREGKVGDDRR